MTNPCHCENADPVERKAYQIRHSPSGLEWIAFVALPKQHPTPIMAPDRDAAIAKAHEWIEAQFTSAKDPT
jgi:hypothetical protein